MGIKRKIMYKISELYNLGLDKHEQRIVESVLDSKDFGKVIVNKSVPCVKNIGFIIPGISKYSGGITSILRLGTYLYDFGYTVSFVDFTGQSITELERNAQYNLSTYKGSILKITETDSNAFDVVIAGNWQAVYFLSHYDAYKMYFVQDYEPYFFKLNERYLLAKQTYETGIHIVSLGNWNIDQIKRECFTTSILESISFPYEPMEYKQIRVRDFTSYSEKKTIKIAVYTKEEGKRIPNILQCILSKAKKEFCQYGITLDIYFFGLKKSYKSKIGVNLGKLSKTQLLGLYGNCDFGMVASMTNLSLVPYEMIASGLPVIEFISGSFTSFFPKGAAILIDFDYKTLVTKLRDCLCNPQLLEEQMDVAAYVLKGLSWKNTAKEFSDILQSITSK